MTTTPTLLVRPAQAADSRLVMRLAALDGAVPPAGDVLLAEVDGEAVAALAPASGQVVADPFRQTAAVVRALTAVAAAR